MTNFSWIPFYMELAPKLLEYKDNRLALLDVIYSNFEREETGYLHDGDGSQFTDIDPFTVYGMFNRGISWKKRHNMIEKFKSIFKVSADIPNDFTGIPCLNNMKSHFFGFTGDRGPNDIDNLWNLFATVLKNSEDPYTKDVEEAYNLLLNQFIIKFNITMGLFWILPYKFISLDSINQQYMVQCGLHKVNKLPAFSEYLKIIESVKQLNLDGKIQEGSFPDFSRKAYNLQSGSESNALMDKIREENPIIKTVIKENYTEADFQGEVFLDKNELRSLQELIKLKKNIILQGAPGVGKTFVARRLAYLMMGEKDKTRVEFIQFHQNYTYEDFIMGYKPNEDGGFILRRGVFYNFCRKAKADLTNDYFFIIDEINRGNLSKIFGELLMLIESDYRGEEHAVKLAYSDELFYVPNNVYIIGMMNTADRSLAMIDYALRRRFSFFDMRPGFDSDGFKKYQERLNNKQFDAIIEEIKRLNDTIEKDDSLGAGFCIGHSYFCNQTIYP